MFTKKHLDSDLNLKLCGKKLKPSNYVRYLGIYLDKYLNWSPRIKHLSQKLVKTNTILCKLWYLASHDLLTKPFCSTLKYGTNAFAASAIKSLNFLQKKFSNNNLCHLFYSQFKPMTKNHFFNSYNKDCS